MKRKRRNKQRVRWEDLTKDQQDELNASVDRAVARLKKNEVYKNLNGHENQN